MLKNYYCNFHTQSKCLINCCLTIGIAFNIYNNYWPSSVTIELLYYKYKNIIVLAGIFRRVRHGRVLRRRRRRNQIFISSIHRRPKQTRFDRTIGRLPVRSSTVRRRPIRSSTVRCRTIRSSTIRSHPLRRFTVRNCTSICLPIRFFIHRLSIRRQDFGRFPIHLLPMNNHYFTPARNTISSFKLPLNVINGKKNSLTIKYWNVLKI